MSTDKEYPNKEILEKNKWQKGKSGNPAGKPKLMISSVINGLEAEGYKPATKPEIVKVYLFLVNLSLPKIKRLVEDSEQPALVRIVGKAVLSKQGFEVIEKILDRSLGKATQSIDHSGQVEIVSPTVKVQFTEE